MRGITLIMSLSIIQLLGFAAHAEPMKVLVPKGVNSSVEKLRAYSAQMVDDATRRAYLSLLDTVVAQHVSNCASVPQAHRSAATRAEVTAIDNTLRTVKSDQGRLVALTLAARTHWFTVAQIRSLVAHLTSGAYRVKALVVLYHRATDPKRFHGVLDLVPDNADQKSLLRQLDGKKALPVGQPIKTR